MYLNKQFNNLFVLEIYQKESNGRNRSYCRCKCICGNENYHILISDLKKSSSCGCIKRLNGKNMTFYVPDDYKLTGTEVEVSSDGKKMISVAGTGWYTNLDHGRRHQPLPLMTMADNIKFSKHKQVKGQEYLKYDNYNAIEVPFTDAIPSDYKGAMGVPISFLNKYNPEQFEILNALNRYSLFDDDDLIINKNEARIGNHMCSINNGAGYTYFRIIIKHRN